jgi:hypothetical protein
VFAGSVATVFMALNCYIGWWYQRLIRHRFTEVVLKLTPELPQAQPDGHGGHEPAPTEHKVADVAEETPLLDNTNGTELASLCGSTGRAQPRLDGARLAADHSSADRDSSADSRVEMNGRQAIEDLVEDPTPVMDRQRPLGRRYDIS